MCERCHRLWPHQVQRQTPAAFTLLELLVVMAIIVVLAAVSLPGLRGLNQSNTISSATRQLQDDLAWARQKAITDRTVVHVVFVPPTIAGMMFKRFDSQNRDERRDGRTGRQIKGEAYSAYGFFAERSAGDQPGQARPRYLQKWHFLPDGVFFADWEFTPLAPAAWDALAETNRPFKFDSFPFPTVAGNTHSVPHIAFDSLGRLLILNQAGNRIFGDEVISLARGSVLVQRDPMTREVIDFDFRETPPGNSTDNFLRLRLDGLTGRARVEQPQIQ